MQDCPKVIRRDKIKQKTKERQFSGFNYIETNLKIVIEWLFVSFFTGLLFYDNIYVSGLIVLFFPLYKKSKQNKMTKNERARLENTFLDALRSLSGALEAGYSIENSITNAAHELKMVYPSTEQIIKEFEYMGNQIKNNIPVESVFYEFSKRNEVDDIASFSEIVVTAKRTGGDLVKIIRSSYSAMKEKKEIMQDIQTSLAGKKYEAAVMKLIPYMILLYFRLFSPDYLTALYDSIQGAVLMTILLCFYILADYITNKIIQIEL